MLYIAQDLQWLEHDIWKDSSTSVQCVVGAGKFYSDCMGKLDLSQVHYASVVNPGGDGGDTMSMCSSASRSMRTFFSFHLNTVFIKARVEQFEAAMREQYDQFEEVSVYHKELNNQLYLSIKSSEGLNR